MELIFVYNANSGIASAILDYGHKVLKPSTYACDLCELTHHNLGERSKWKDYRKQLKMELTFMYKNKFQNDFPDQKIAFPCVLTRNGSNLDVLVEKDDFKTLISVEDLIEVMDQKLSRIS